MILSGVFCFWKICNVILMFLQETLTLGSPSLLVPVVLLLISVQILDLTLMEELVVVEEDEVEDEVGNSLSKIDKNQTFDYTYFIFTIAENTKWIIKYSWVLILWAVMD